MAKQKYIPPSLHPLSGGVAQGQTEGTCTDGGRPYSECVEGNIFNEFVSCGPGGFVRPLVGCSPEGTAPGSIGCSTGNAPEMSDPNCSTGSVAPTLCEVGGLA